MVRSEAYSGTASPGHGAGKLFVKTLRFGLGVPPNTVCETCADQFPAYTERMIPRKIELTVAGMEVDGPALGEEKKLCGYSPGIFEAKGVALGQWISTINASRRAASF